MHCLSFPVGWTVTVAMGGLRRTGNFTWMDLKVLSNRWEK
jgi:hypothetical protein